MILKEIIRPPVAHIDDRLTESLRPLQPLRCFDWQLHITRLFTLVSSEILDSPPYGRLFLTDTRIITENCISSSIWHASCWEIKPCIHAVVYINSILVVHEPADTAHMRSLFFSLSFRCFSDSVSKGPRVHRRSPYLDHTWNVHHAEVC